MGRVGNKLDKLLMLGVSALLGLLAWSLQHNVGWFEREQASAQRGLLSLEGEVRGLDKRVTALETSLGKK